MSVTPAYAEGPDGHDRPGCEAASPAPAWTLGTVVFLNETGDDPDAIPSQSIQFHVTNAANGHVARCLAYFSAGPGEDPAVRMTCSGDGGGGGGLNFARRSRYAIQTQTVFHPRRRVFGINQTWYCDDVDPAKPCVTSLHH